MKNIAVLGSTGSIGSSTLDICERYPDRYNVVSLAAGHNTSMLLQQCVRWRPSVVSINTEENAALLERELRTRGINDTAVLYGREGTIAVATLPEVDFVVSAIVGLEGLEATYASAIAGKTIGLASKECLVAAGDLILTAAREHNATLLPIDSEHNAIHQCMRAGTRPEISQIWLTASGGPFLRTPLEEFDYLTPAQALKHPTWSMGKRISVDSATMLNKGLEVIEAAKLFGLAPSQVKVTIHPQSTVHSLVEYVDGSFLAQLSATDMRLPILYALSYPERVISDFRLDFAGLSRLDFSQPDLDRFPCLRLAYEAAEIGGSLPIALNAADETAVEAFLEGSIKFTSIPRVIERVLSVAPIIQPKSIREVVDLDWELRETAYEAVMQEGGR